MSQSRTATILCIDDDAEVLRLRRQLLEVSGYSVVTAASGVEGLRMLAEGRHADLILLDYMMPGMTGKQIAEELRRLHPAMPIVLMSGFPEIPENLLKMVDGYVRKGEDPEVVLQVITNALPKKQ
jgi:CheY-like chemotaxis protein